MSTFPKYDRYKDSGVEWLGEIPKHWEVESLRAAAQLFVEKNRPDLPVLSVYREYGVILKDSREDNHNATSLDTSNYKVVQPGDLAVNKMKAWQGSLGVSEHHGIVSPAYITCRLNQKKVSGRYIHYLLRSKSLVGALDSISYGVRVGQWDMRFEDFKKVGITIPPKPEQDRIVAFLDRKTAEIDALIAKKQRQIELLDEQKTILINRAVTRGLNPNAKLKPSGIEWIGEIPEHWKVDRLFSIFNERVDTGHGHLPMLNITISRGVSVEEFDGDRPKRLIEDRNSYKRAAVGDIAYNMMRMWQGAVGNVETEGLVSPAYVVARPIRDINSFYFSSMFRGRAFQIETNKFSYGIVTDRNRLYWLGFKSIFVPLPPRAEQDAIAEHIKNVQEIIKKSQNVLQGQIENLKNLRSTLIAHAVTGRIKV